MKRILFGLVGLLLLAPAQAMAQATPSTALADVVATCNTRTYNAGDSKPITQTAGGVLCDQGASGGATAANQTGVQGVVGAGTAPANQVVSGGIYNSTPLTLTTGQSSADQHDANGYQITRPYALSSQGVSGITTAMTGTTSTAVTGMGAPGSGLKNHITTVICGNSHATVGTFVDLQDGSGGTVFATFPAAPAYGGAAPPFPFEIIQPTANTALYAVNKTTGANVICTVIGFKAP